MSYCEIARGHPFHGPYHDEEYGFPVDDDDVLFERLVLEINQAGLSWLTILKKRQAFRHAYYDFDIDRVSRMTAVDKTRLTHNEGIIRNRLKINSAVTNARSFLEVKKEFGSFDEYVWRFVNGKPLKRKPGQPIAARTELSDALSKDLLKRGFKFVGSTICYSFMQAVGMVNDHDAPCFRYPQITQMSK